MQSGQTTQADLLIEQNQFEQYQDLCEYMLQACIEGGKGMMQHWFANKENADALVVWLKQQKNLQALGINKAGVEQKTQQDASIAYVVRLTKEQHAAILASAPPAVTPAADPPAQLSADDKALVEVNKATGRSGLDNAAFTLNEQAFMVLVAKASVAAIDEALVKRDNDGWTALYTAARYQSEQAFMALVAKASAVAIDAALVKQDQDKNNGGWTVLHTAARYQSERAFMALVVKASVATIDAALVIQNNNGWTALQMAVRYQSERAFMALVAKASVTAIDAALVIQNKDGWTALQMAARHQSEQAFMALVNKASPAALFKSMTFKTKDILAAIFSNQSPVAVARLLVRMHPEDLKSLVVPGGYSSFIIRKCASYLIHEPSWRNPVVVKNCFAMMSSQLVTELLECWQAGQMITPELALQINKYLVERPPHSLTRLEKDWLGFEEDRAQENFAAQLAGSNKRLSMEQMLENKHHIAAWVFEFGIASWKDYHLLRVAQGDIPHLKEALDRLQSADLLFSGCKDQIFIPTATSSELEDLLKKIAQDNVLFKMIQEKDWDEFFGQIADYNTRPATLRKPDVKKQATHKYKHIDGKIEAYKAKGTSQAQKQKQAKPHTHTKKLSTTLMARDLSTTVFGESHDRELVGVLFDRGKCRLKAMLAHDSGTYLHEWIGAKSDVEDYAKRMEPINYTATDKFIECVNKHSHRTNEVLAELSREAMLAIVIARDTPNARQIALDRCKEIKDKLNITLPIVFYDNVKRTVKPYTTQQILQDVRGINMDREALAMAQLMQLKTMISLKSDWRVYSFFSFFNFGANSDVKPKTAREVLAKIKKAEQDERAGEYPWVTTAQEIKKLLKHTNAKPSFFRYQDTVKFYQDAYQQVFSPTRM